MFYRSIVEVGKIGSLSINDKGNAVVAIRNNNDLKIKKYIDNNWLDEESPNISGYVSIK